MKPFINSAILGNSRVLVSFDNKSQFQRIYWPHIDSIQHLDKMLLGLFFPEEDNTMYWLDNNNFSTIQKYINQTNILQTTIEANDIDIKIVFTDFVLINSDIIIRNIKITNSSNKKRKVNFCTYCSNIKEITNPCSTFFDYKTDSIVFSRKDDYMFLSSNIECNQFQLTNNPFEACNRLFLYGVDDYSLSSEGAMLWELGEIESGECVSFNIYIAFGKELNGTRKLCQTVKLQDYNKLYNYTETYWNNFIKNVKSKNIKDNKISSLFYRSILVLKLLSGESGGIIASAEIDEEYRKSGGYAYCWPRDAVFITTALDRVGLTDISEKFYEWALSTQDEQGFWHQRYFVNGSLAPSWGLQLDETASIIWGLFFHYQTVKDNNILFKAKDSIYRAAQYLAHNIYSKNGLPNPTYDLWEMTIGQHIYTSACVCAALTSAVQIGDIVRYDKKTIENWYNIAKTIKFSIENHLWSVDKESYIKSINAKLNPWGEENGPSLEIIVNKKGYWRNFLIKDDRIDSSLLGLIFPFDIFDIYDSKIKSSVCAIEKKLQFNESLGVMRFEGDQYMGGNPWIINTIWLGLYYTRIGFYEKAKEILFWVERHATELELLPEQIDKYTGRPIWVIPLAWSHAMYIHLTMELIENNIEL